MTRLAALDMFAGCGGASHGLAAAGYTVTGLELDPTAAATHHAAGHITYVGDIANIDPNPTVGWFDHLHASPPCTTFSTAGTGKGRHHLDDLADAVKRVLHGEPHGLTDIDTVTLLTLEPARWIHAHRPRTISFEQVRAVLPVWQAYADALPDLGYSAWAGLLHAEQYGLPQARIRAWLIARNDGQEAAPPTPTHSRYYPRTPDKLDPGVARWVTMADALGWGMTARPTHTVTSGGADTGGAEPFGNGARQQMAKAADRGEWLDIGRTDKRPRNSDEPSRTLTGESAWWEWSRPSTTVCGDPRLSGPGRNDPNVPGSQFNKPTSRRLTVTEALVLQGFPADYPLHGSKTSQFKQIGNAVPPPVMQAVAETLR